MDRTISEPACTMLTKNWRVLIVDDEFRIGMLIKKLIKWDELAMECIGVVNNGEAAYQIIMERSPHIVITDIRMPKMNGLELIRVTKEAGKQARFIVVSGYKEFDYVHKALKYGVADYLLKPINELELNKVFDKICAELRMEIMAQKKEESLKSIVTVSKHIIKKNILNNIVERKIFSIDEVGKDYQLGLSAEAYRGIVIKLDYCDNEKTNRQQDFMTVERVIEIIESGLKEGARGSLISEKENLYIYCLLNYEFNRSKKAKSTINNVLTEIKEYLMDFDQYEVTVGIGEEKSEFGQIRFSIQEALRAVNNRIKLGTGRLIYSDALPMRGQKSVSDCLEPYKASFLASIDTYNKESLEQTVFQIYKEFHLWKELDFSICYDLARELISLFFEYIEVCSEEGDNLTVSLLSQCQHCYTLDRLKELLAGSLGEYLGTCLKAIRSESIKPIRQAKQYIDEHYGERIVLEDIAMVVGLNPVYFSVLFKKETGVNFSAYIVNVRMNAAKEMIRNENETIAAIAERVGYKGARYFSRLFAKTVGVKPALYRKLHS